MKVVALVSGGKDSCFAMMKCLQYGHEIIALANLMPVDEAEDELDSYMYQTVGHQIVVTYARCMGVPLFRKRIQGSTRYHDLSYRLTPGDEVEDMFILLDEVKRQIPSVTAVSSGAIASDYQRLRVESVCSRLGLVSLAYLWKQDQSSLLQEMIKSGIIAITVKVAAIGLDPSKHLGKEITFLEPHLHKLKELYGINVCGEGGEYETLTLDCPLFKNARIVLDEFETVLHSPDSIAPVGVLHPLAFHLEEKIKVVVNGKQSDAVDSAKLDAVYEVVDNCQRECGELQSATDIGLSLSEAAEREICISKTRKDNTFSVSCWLQDQCTNSSELQKDLELVLTKIEKELAKRCYSWESVLYIHLYISNMNEFTTANDTYVRFITQEKCQYGVPSRSTIELPLLQAGFGKAYIEVLVANDSTKRVLHVQSISCWAPSCIGPYSQATVHKDILYMAGQLGLEPPTMLLCSGGATAELEQALENSEAVAKSFNCSISTSSILLVIYCSTSINKLERDNLEEKKDDVLKQMKLQHLEDRSSSDILDPVLLYVFVPDLPKRALVEVKPILHFRGDEEIETDDAIEDLSTAPNYWGFQHEKWHDTCLQKSIVYRKICAAILSVNTVIAANICNDAKISIAGVMECQFVINDELMGRIARFCIYKLDELLRENHFSWDDILSLRFYFPKSLGISHGRLSLTLSTAFDEFAEMSGRINASSEPMFNLVPVMSAGRNPSSTDDILTCELFSRRF